METKPTYLLVPAAKCLRLIMSTHNMHTREPSREKWFCHINMLKLNNSREAVLRKQVKTLETAVPEAHSLVYMTCVYHNNLRLPSAGQQCGRLLSSEFLSQINSHLCHLSEQQRGHVVNLLYSLFSDIQSRTNILEHGICVSDTKPVKQHAYHCPFDKREKMKR